MTNNFIRFACATAVLAGFLLSGWSTTVNAQNQQLLGTPLQQQSTRQSAGSQTPSEDDIVVPPGVNRMAYIHSLYNSPQAMSAAPQVAPNPDMPSSLLCQDFRVIFVLDESGSIDNTESQLVRQGVRSLALALLNSGADLHVIEFATEASVINLGGSLVTPTFINNLNLYLGNNNNNSGNPGFNGQRYRTFAAGCDGRTNWEAGLIAAQGIAADLVIFFTDGNPTAYNVTNGNCAGGTVAIGNTGGVPVFPGFSNTTALNNAIVQANAVKAQGKHMFVAAVGDDLNLSNCQKISGNDNFAVSNNVFTADYVVGQFETLAFQLEAAANNVCGTELSISKTVSTPSTCVGSQVTFTISVTNTGGDFNFTAVNTRIQDVVPSGFSNPQIVAPVPVGASFSGNTLNYNIGDLAAGQTRSISFTATVMVPPASFNNVATADANNANLVSDDAPFTPDYAVTTVNETACISYTWFGTTYTSSGSYERTFNNANGCPQKEILNLTITPQSAQPQTACWQTATFNASTCSWDITGTQPQAPEVACYQTATFNPTTCSYDVTGSEPVAPEVACYQTATFNPSTCSYDVTGSMPPMPEIESYQTATFNEVSCQWDVTGNPPTEGCYGAEVWAFSQGTTKSGGAVRPERSFAIRALGAPNGQTPAIYAPIQEFVALGFGGSIEIRFENPIANGPGADIKIWESSAGSNNETATISVSQDGLGYFPVGTITMDGEVDFASAFSDYIQYVKITDITNPATWGNSDVADGFDVDAVECLHGAYQIPTPQTCAPVEYMDFFQGPSNDLLTPVADARSNPEEALGTPENSDAVTSSENNNFVSLGFGGSIVLKFGYPIKNGPGDDIFVVETTFNSAGANRCSRYPERIRVFASQDNCNWVYLGENCQDTYFDLKGLNWAQYVKLVDVSDPTAFNGLVDGYDLDGVLCLHGEETNPTPTELVFGSAQEVIAYNPGDRANGTDVVANRRQPGQSLGMPQNTDVVNFVALGFNGSLTVKFDYVIFDAPGADIHMVETTFGSATCASYPERAMVEGSLDGVNWVVLTEEICLDGSIDVAAAGAIQYIRVTDRSKATDFGGSADGYDVDGFVVLHSCASAPARLADPNADNVSVADEVISSTAYPNPFDADVQVSINTGDQDDVVVIRVMNNLGQVVMTKRLNVAPSSEIVETLSLQGLRSGIYMLNVETSNAVETIKLVKK
jgi:uncharacterized repeat protein (TIGR01451 family)